jgi:hypothetical protein
VRERLARGGVVLGREQFLLGREQFLLGCGGTAAGRALAGADAASGCAAAAASAVMIWSSPVIWGLDPSRDLARGTLRAVQRWLRVSCLGCHAQTSGCAQGMAQALPGLLTVPGCSGFGVQQPGGVQPLGVRQQVALPLTGEFPADVGVHEHGVVLSAWIWGFGSLDDQTCGSAWYGGRKVWRRAWPPARLARPAPGLWRGSGLSAGVVH